ncbi:MAG: translation initiation factor IF-2, partial [Actinomycetes bacterium]
MARKRVHEIAKDLGMTSKDLLAVLNAAGVEAKAAASSVEESDAKAAVAAGSKAAPSKVAPAKAKKPAAKPESAAKHAPAAKPAAAEKPAPAAQPAPPQDTPTPTREEAEAAAGPGKRRVVIDSQANRRPATGGPPQGAPGRRPRRRGGRRRSYDEVFADAETRPADATTQVIRVNSGSTVKDVSEYLGVPVPDVIKKLIGLGEMATLTQTLSDETIEVLAGELDREVEIVHSDEEAVEAPDFNDTDAQLIDRPPVVTVMGHVDHGKTSLLDAIRKTEVAAGEAGGITQHIGAYQVHVDGRIVTFLDTPGHQAFTAMRARGAQVTDIAVIVVAADDGVKPQTIEAVDHAKAAGVPMLVAVNKIDKEGAQPDRVRGEMAELGLQPVDWGGETEFCDVSAKSGEGLEALLETLVVMADLEELKANPNTDASGTVIESRLDPGRGAVVSILVQRGTLRIGDPLAAGAHWGRVRAMHDHTGERVLIASPGEPVEVLGFGSVPDAGEFVRMFNSDRDARESAKERGHRLKTEALARRSGRRVSLEEIFSSGIQELNL